MKNNELPPIVDAAVGSPDLCVFIGRFQPLHAGHIRVIREGLARTAHMIVLVGCANEARAFRNPFTAAERVAMIQATFEHDPRLIVLALEDSTYDINDWLGRANRAVDQTWEQIAAQNPAAPKQPSIALIGHDKDATTYYLDLFPQWSFIDVASHAMLSATDIRHAYFGTFQEGMDLLARRDAAAAQEQALAQSVAAQAIVAAGRRRPMVEARAYLATQLGNSRDGKSQLSMVDHDFFQEQLNCLERRTVADAPTTALDLPAISGWLADHTRYPLPFGQSEFLDDLAVLDADVSALWQPHRARLLDQANRTPTPAQARAAAESAFVFDYLMQSQKRASAFLLRERALQSTDQALLPLPVIVFLEEFLRTPAYRDLSAEYAHAAKSRYDWRGAPYPPLFSTGDAVVIHQDHVLLIRRKGYPGKGLWALPGGFVEHDEPVQSTALRELDEETGIHVPRQELAGLIREHAVFDAPFRSSRGRTITHAVLIMLPDGDRPAIKTGGLAGDEETFDIAWIHLDHLRRDQFFEDHYSIIASLLRQYRRGRR